MDSHQIKTTEDKMKEWEIMKAHEEGAEIEFKQHEDDDWLKATTPSWDWSYFYYRIKPATDLAKITPGTHVIANCEEKALLLKDMDDELKIYLIKGDRIVFYGKNNIKIDNKTEEQK